MWFPYKTKFKKLVLFKKKQYLITKLYILKNVVKYCRIYANVYTHIYFFHTWAAVSTKYM